MATFTWTATTAGGVKTWETAANWVASDASNPTFASFTSSPGNDYLINSSNNFTIGNISTVAPDTANSLTVTDFQSTLLLTDGATLEVTSALTLDGLLNLGTASGGSVLSMGGVGGGGTINLQSVGRLEGALGDSIQDAGTTPTMITGSGTVIAENGIFQIGPSVRVAPGDTTKFQIDPGATLAFADAVGGGTITFATALGTSGNGVLNVGALFTFNGAVKGLYVGSGENTETTYVDFLNVGANASATLTNVTTTSATINIFTDAGSQSIQILGNYTGQFVNYLPDGNVGTNVFITNQPCYGAGTLILTPDGEVAIETLRAGDRVMTSEDGCLVARAVIWAGERTIDLTGHPHLGSVAPIRFRAGSLGDNLPRRDLLLSPDHCLFIDGALFPAKLLINDMTIVRDTGVSTIAYHHLELERHAVLIAEGVPAESYLDTGNRAYFANAGLAMLLHPEFGINEHFHCWETDACAPLVVRPEAVKPVWDRFAARAVSLGFSCPGHATTADPGIRLMVDGRTMRPLAARLGKSEGTNWPETVCFMVPEGAASVRLLSRSGNPGALRPWLDDPRRLGVAVRSMVLRDRGGEVVVGADHPALTDGWHDAEYDSDGAMWRWSDGNAALPLVADGPCLLEITLSETLTYINDGERLAA